MTDNLAELVVNGILIMFAVTFMWPDVRVVVK